MTEPGSDSDSDPDPEFRRIPIDRLDDYQAAVDYAFTPEDGPSESDPDDVEDLADEPGARFGVFVGDDLRSVCKHYDFTARLRDDWVPLAGLAAVATPPEHRRQGYVRRAIEASLDRWCGEYPLSALWPFDHGYYRQFGWATSNAAVEYTCPPAALATARDGLDEDQGEFRQVAPDEWELLQNAHETHAADRTLTLRRDGDWWRKKVFRVDDGEADRFVAAWERDGSVRGYLVYDFERSSDDPDDRRLQVRDFAFGDHEAYRRLLGYLADHDSQASEVSFSREAETTLFDIVDDPREVDCEAYAGPMVRVVDVEHGLSAMTYPDDVTVDLTLAVTDDTAPWNDDTFRLRVENGEGFCERSDASTVEADATLGVGALSQLVVGYRDVPTLRRVAGLDVADDSVVETLAAVFPPETVYLRQFF